MENRIMDKSTITRIDYILRELVQLRIETETGLRFDKQVSLLEALYLELKPYMMVEEKEEYENLIDDENTKINSWEEYLRSFIVDKVIS